MPSQTIHFTAEQYADMIEQKPDEQSVSEWVRHLVSYGLESKQLADNVQRDNE